MSDVLQPIAQSDSRSPYLVIGSLVGRTERMPVFLNRDGVEDFISPHSINEIFIAGVTRFQMQLVDKNSFRFMVVLDSSLDDARRASAIVATERRLRELLDQKWMNNVAVSVVPAKDLPVNPATRKFELIVNAPAPCGDSSSPSGPLPADHRHT
jgi:hypothetical protein